jgi:ABC-2 type transport system ATP-binding protein
VCEFALLRAVVPSEKLRPFHRRAFLVLQAALLNSPFWRSFSALWNARMEMLKVDRLTKLFGRRKAADAVSFSVNQGEVCAFLGPNGAGKSTTLRMIAGYLEPDGGDAIINGVSVLKDRTAAQISLGYLAEGAPLYPDLSVKAFLGFLARAHGLKPEAARAAIARVASDAQIQEVLGRPIETLSKGFRRRVALAGAIIHDPPVLVLDEPTDGLDPNQKQAMRSLVKRMAASKAILISTHQLDEVEAMCARAVVIDRGRIVADATPAELAASAGGSLEEAFHGLTYNHTQEETA